MATTFVRPRLKDWFPFSRSRFFQILYILHFRSFSENDSEGCLSVKGCGEGLQSLWESFLAASFASQSGATLFKKDRIMFVSNRKRVIFALDFHIGN